MNKMKMYAILIKASRIVIVDAKDEIEAQKLAMSEGEIRSYHIDEAETEQNNLKPEDVEIYLRHDAQDLRL